MVQEPVELTKWNPQGSELIKSVELKPPQGRIQNHRGSGRHEVVVREPVGLGYGTTEVPAGVRWWFENQWDGDMEPAGF